MRRDGGGGGGGGREGRIGRRKPVKKKVKAFFLRTIEHVDLLVNASISQNKMTSNDIIKIASSIKNHQPVTGL